MNTWKAQNLINSELLGDVEFEVDGQWHHFTIFNTGTHLVFGGYTNAGFIESGNYEIDDCFSVDEHLQALIDNLEIYYRDGKEYTEDNFYCNERM